MVLKPEKEALARKIFAKWGLDFAVIGKTTDTLRFVVKHQGEVKADLPIKELGDEAPLYDRPFTKRVANSVLATESVPAPKSADRNAREIDGNARLVLTPLGVGAI